MPHCAPIGCNKSCHYKFLRKSKTIIIPSYTSIHKQRTMYALSKINKQHEQTWVALQKRLNSVQFNFETIFTNNDTYKFIHNKAISVGSCDGYVIPSLLTTTAYVLAQKGTKIETTTHKQPMNLYTLFIGYPGTGKSSAIQHAATEPLDALELNDTIISTATSSGLVKSICKNEKGILLSPEIYDCLNKLLKSDEENATGDIQLLCKLFSGEPATYVYATEKKRQIKDNTPFSVLGSTQLRNAAKLMARMDHGHGLIDRFLVTAPIALRPTLTQIESAKDYLETEATEDFKRYFLGIDTIDDNTTYHFTNDAKQLLRETTDAFVAEVNDAITKGEMPPKSKKPDIVPRMATALHLLNFTLDQVLSGHADAHVHPSLEIAKETLVNAIELVEHLESHKTIMCEFVKDITNEATEKAISQPSPDGIKESVILSPGPMVTFNSFKHVKRSYRTIAQEEYSTATTSLVEDGFGRIVEFRLPRARSTCKVFVKSNPSPWPTTTQITQEQFQNAVSKPISSDITNNMREYLTQNGHLNQS